MTEQQRKYVAVLAHADGWGALSANKIVRHLRDKYPDVDVHLIVSTATKGEDGKIRTAKKLLELPRKLKETDMLPFFDHIDRVYAKMKADDALVDRSYEGKTPRGAKKHEVMFRMYEHGKRTGVAAALPYLTFNQLAQRYCAGHPEKAHYTTAGGPKGGEEAAAVIAGLETKYGHGPEVLLSVDTMAILPATLLGKYQCFSCHPGPLDTLKVPGMQGTLRPLVNEIFYNAKGELMPEGFELGTSEQELSFVNGRHPAEYQAHLKGTLFMQAPKLDEGPAIGDVLVPVSLDQSAYEVRDKVYDKLTDLMIKHLPILLDPAKRAILVEKAMAKKKETDAHPHRELPALQDDRLSQWMQKAVLDMSADEPVVVHSQLVDPDYFRSVMKGFYPGDDAEFTHYYNKHFGTTAGRIVDERRGYHSPIEAYLTTRGVTYRRINPVTGEDLFAVKNEGESVKELLAKLARVQGIEPDDEVDPPTGRGRW